MRGRYYDCFEPSFGRGFGGCGPFGRHFGEWSGCGGHFGGFEDGPWHHRHGGRHFGHHGPHHGPGHHGPGHHGPGHHGPGHHGPGHHGPGHHGPGHHGPGHHGPHGPGRRGPWGRHERQDSGDETDRPGSPSGPECCEDSGPRSGTEGTCCRPPGPRGCCRRDRSRSKSRGPCKRGGPGRRGSPCPFKGRSCRRSCSRGPNSCKRKFGKGKPKERNEETQGQETVLIQRIVVEKAPARCNSV